MGELTCTLINRWCCSSRLRSYYQEQKVSYKHFGCFNLKTNDLAYCQICVSSVLISVLYVITIDQSFNRFPCLWLVIMTYKINSGPC